MNYPVREFLYSSYLLLLVFIPLECSALELTNFFGNKNTHWNLPIELNDSNTNVKFEVDSTLHLISGISKHISGKAWLKDDKKPSSIKAEISFPIKFFNTGNESRDSKMRKVMNAARYPNVKFSIQSTSDICLPSSLENKRCEAKLIGNLSIRGISKQISIPILIKKSLKGYDVHGKTSFKWADFGIEDPSTFLAKLYEDVTVSFKCTLKN